MKNLTIGLAFLLSSGCVAETSPAPVAGESLAAAKADSACGEAYIRFLLEDARPVLEDASLDEAKADALVHRAVACDDGAAYSTYLGLLAKHVSAVEIKRAGAARAAFLLAGSPSHGDYEQFVASLAPTALDELRFRTLAALKPTPTDGFSYVEWLDMTGTLFEDVTTPLETPLGVATEPMYRINVNEARWLAAFEAARPAPDLAADEALEHFASTAYDVFIGADRVPALAPSTFSTAALTPDHHDALQRFAGYRPAVASERGSAEWVARFALLGVGSDPAFAASLERLDLFATSRPERLFGLDAYRDFLEYLPLTEGIAERILRAKPCVAGADADAAYASFVAERERFPRTERERTVIAAAAPTACE